MLGSTWIVNRSGVEITTLGLPLHYGSFASKSPIVRDTDSLPGRTRWIALIPDLASYTFPPALMILSLSENREGLWSWVV